MVGARADENLLFGILALQLDFIHRDQLITAMNAWVLDKQKPLGRILVEQGTLAPDAEAVLAPLVAKHLELHHGDPQQSLAALRIPGAVQRDLEQFTDRDVQASLAGVGSSSSLAQQPTLPLAAQTSSGERFEVLRPHAWGGLGEVCVARDRELNREVALKRIHERHADDAFSCERFLLEAEITGSLEHPGIVPVYGLGAEADGRPYYAMRFIRGETLKEAIRRYYSDKSRSESERRVELRQLLGRFIAVCNAIEYAHSRGVIHRDIKPSNIMLGKFGETLVVDWGLAKAVGRSGTEAARDESTIKPMSASGSSETLPGSAVGTPSYMSPEQADGRVEEIGPASDVYSLGATLYTLLTGKEPFESSVVGVVLGKVQAGDFMPPRECNRDVPRPLNAICLKAMSLWPQNRYSSCSALVSDIEHWLADEPVEAYEEPITAHVALWMRRHRVVTATAAALLAAAFVGLVIGTAFLSATNVRIAEHADEAVRQRDKATRQKQLAVDAQQEATRERDAATRQLYVSQMSLAQRAWDDNLPGRARELLESQTPEQTGGVDLRGWEWHYLRRLTHSEMRTLKFWALCLAFTPDGKHLVSGSYDGTLKLWTADGSREVRSIKAHQDRLVRLGLNSEGKILATGSRDGTVKIWDTQTLHQLRSFPTTGGGRFGFALSPDGTRVAVASRPLGSNLETDVNIWDVFPASGTSPSSGSGTERADDGSPSDRAQQPTLVLKGHTSSVGSLAYTPDSGRLVSGSPDGTIRIWDAKTGKEERRFEGFAGSISSIALSPDGRLLASGGSQGGVILWDVATGRALRHLRGHTRKVTGVAFSPDGRRLASSSDDTNVTIWDVQSGQEIQTLRGHASNVIDVRFSPDGNVVASGGWDETLRLWDAASGQEPWSLRLPTGVSCVAYSPDGNALIAGDGNETAVWNASTGQSRWREPEAIPSYITSTANTLRFDPASRLVASALRDGSVNLRDAQTGRVLKNIAAHTGEVRSVAISPDGRRLATGGVDGSVALWNLPDGGKITLWKAHTDIVTHVVFSPDGTLLASTGQEKDKLIRLWDAMSGKEIRTLVGHEGGVYCAVFSPDGRRLFTGARDETIRWWDVETGRTTRVVRAHSGDVLSLAISPDGRRLASSSDDETIHIRDVETGQEVLTLKPGAERILSVAFSPDGLQLAAGTQNKGVLVWDARTLTPELRAELIAARADQKIVDLVESVFQTYLLKDLVIEAIKANTSISEPDQKKALELAQQRNPSPVQLNNRSWSVVSDPGRSAVDYNWGLRWAEAAYKQAPNEGVFLNTLGVAQFRAEKYTDAIATLSRSNQVNAKNLGSSHPADVAFLAMAHHKLGESEKAREHLSQVRQLVESDRWKGDTECRAFVQEATNLISPPARTPVEAVKPAPK